MTGQQRRAVCNLKLKFANDPDTNHCDYPRKPADFPGTVPARRARLPDGILDSQ